MTFFEELNEQNHRISELSQITLFLVKDRRMCDMDTTCDIFIQFVDAVNDHLKLEDTKVYNKLLTHSDDNVIRVGTMFMSGSAEIKKIFQSYMKKWCDNKKLRVKDHDAFVADTEEIMHIVNLRIQDEAEKLHPLVRQVIEAA